LKGLLKSFFVIIFDDIWPVKRLKMRERGGGTEEIMKKDITFDDLKEYIFLNPLSPLHYLGFCHYYFVSISLML
jgi:hypothetical protein